jgi:hypothetical protein
MRREMETVRSLLVAMADSRRSLMADQPPKVTAGEGFIATVPQ